MQHCSKHFVVLLKLFNDEKFNDVADNI